MILVAMSSVKGVYFMLTEKHKNVVEQIANEFQKKFMSKKSVDIIYDFESFTSFLEIMGCKIYYSAKCNKAQGKEIYFSFKQEQINIAENRKIFFHEVWHFIACELRLFDNATRCFDKNYSIEISEMTAGYFSRAMNMPEKYFISNVIKNTDLKGSCNIFKVAEEFDVEFTDVIGRGNDLNLWNRKVGI